MTIQFERCYQKAGAILGPTAEPLSVATVVENHRRYWRPKSVHTVLLAESHVYTNPNECVAMRGRTLIHPCDTPESFVRLVYCLGYGEPDYVGRSVAPNSGTWQYWKIFSSCVTPPSNESFAPLLKTRNRTYASRIKAKVALLERLRSRGVWLVDASILALYRPGGARTGRRVCEHVLACCWDNYIGHVLQECRPRSIIVIGHNVARALTGRLDEITRGHHTVVSQPQAHVRSEEGRGIHETYFRVCNAQPL